MSPESVNSREMVDAIYRSEGPRVLSTLIRLLGDFDLAEDALHEAFVAAVERWPRDGMPANPRAWLVSAGRFKGIDAIRREARLFAPVGDIVEPPATPPEFLDDAEDVIEDDRLRLIFICCHPALSTEGQVALVLREVCGLTTEEIASAFLTPVPTIAQRIVRAKAKIRQARIPYEVPPIDELVARTQAVLQVTYLLFSEGYYASSGDSLTRQILSEEAIRLGRLIAELLPEPEVLGLLALMLLNESRRSSRTSPAGDIVLLPDQDHSLWDRALIQEGIGLVTRSFESPSLGPYSIQAGIAAAHVEGALAGETDWNRIVGLYDLLMRHSPSPVVELNRAAAVSYRDGPLVGLSLVEVLLAGGELDRYGLAHATRGDICRRLGRLEDARRSYTRALEFTSQGAERRFLEGRLQEVSPPIAQKDKEFSK